MGTGSFAVLDRTIRDTSFAPHSRANRRKRGCCSRRHKSCKRRLWIRSTLTLQTRSSTGRWCWLRRREPLGEGRLSVPVKCLGNVCIFKSGGDSGRQVVGLCVTSPCCNVQQPGRLSDMSTLRGSRPTSDMFTLSFREWSSLFRAFPCVARIENDKQTSERTSNQTKLRVYYDHKKGLGKLSHMVRGMYRPWLS